jgi:ribonuclease D
MIQTPSQLNDFLSRIESDTVLAIDTEFKRIDTYHPILCLLQIKTDNHIACIDILALKDLTPLFNKLYQKDSLWVVHSAKQDLEALYILSKRFPKQLFDTQIAAAFLNHSMQISYQALTLTLANKHLEKAYTRLDWSQRPLPEAAIQYALDDVQYLLGHYYQLNEQLRQAEKLNWVKADSLALCQQNLYEVNPCEAWRKVKGFTRLNHAHAQLAAQLAGWRESQAIKLNKPRQWIIKDEALLAYAQNKIPLTKKINSSFALWQSTTSHISINFQATHKTAPTQTEKTKKNELQKHIQKVAIQYNLNPQILATGKALLNYIRGDRSVIFCTGWRGELLKEALCKTT